MKIKKRIKQLLGYLGQTHDSIQSPLKNSIVELDDKDTELIEYILNSKYSMSSVRRLVNTVKSCRYVVENNIAGDFVECGVWRGGNSILAKKIFEHLGSDRCVWMFDTFEGMTAPTSVDIEAINQMSAESKFVETTIDPTQA